jgi:hypothetical protein
MRPVRKISKFYNSTKSAYFRDLTRVMDSYKLTELEAAQLAFSHPLEPPADDHADRPQTGPNSGNVTSSIQTPEQAVQLVDNKTGLQLRESQKLALMEQ